MSEIIMLSVVAGALGLSLWLIIMRILTIEGNLARKLDNMNGSIGLSDDLKQEIYDLLQMALEDSVGNMQLPNAKDHIFGAVAELIKYKLGGFDPRNIIKDGIESLTYGQEEIETEKESQ